MTEPSPFLADLPAHHYGVYVANDMDALWLRYPIDKVGVEKVAASALEYSLKYPGSKIFVSTLLKYYRVKVPSRLFAPANVPLYRVPLGSSTKWKA